MTRLDLSQGSLAFTALATALLACSQGAQQPAPTYYQDVQPIIQSKCVGCHNANGIGPFPLESASDVTSRSVLIRSAVASRTMPPWPPDDSCTPYARDRSLTDDQIKTLTDWVDQGAVPGDPAAQVTGQPAPGLSRVDFSLQMPEAFTPTQSPDHFRCFLVDWMPGTTKYVTGLGVRPGDPHIVHHVIAVIATPSQVAQYQALDAADPGPGWDCFGGTGGGNQAQWLAAWAPGALGTDFPPGTGVRVDPGSKIVIQVHYNTAAAAPGPDQTRIDIEVADAVDKPAWVMPFADPNWLKGNLKIPAGAPDTMYSYGIDVTPYLGLLTGGVLAGGKPATVYGAAMHMHTRGAHILGRINRGDGSQECMLDIPRWSFNWQGSYGFGTAKTINPGDELYLECHWDNTAANQPYVNGQQVPPRDLNWGETTEDEMCAEILYLTQ